MLTCSYILNYTDDPTIYSSPLGHAMEKSLGSNLSRVSSISSSMFNPVQEKGLETEKQRESQFPDGIEHLPEL